MNNSQIIPKSYTYAETGHDEVIDSHSNTGNLTELRRLALERRLAQNKDSRYRFDKK